jgi:hypothetical protein
MSLGLHNFVESLTSNVVSEFSRFDLLLSGEDKRQKRKPVVIELSLLRGMLDFSTQ